MSLFGDDFPDDSRARNSGLFDDTPASKAGGNSLFSDDLDHTSSPWALPTPKKAARAQLVKTLLPTSEVPDSYIDAFDNLLESSGTQRGEISVDAAKKLIAEAAISADAQSKISGIVLPTAESDATGIGRNEFNVLLALIGLAQEGEDVTLDSVDERRRRKLLLACFVARELGSAHYPIPSSKLRSEA
jgi:sorting nexin-8